jgi:putative phage-type endonuclease
MIIYDKLDQRTEDWHRIRAGKLTGSDFHTLMGNGETKNNLLLKKTAERLHGYIEEDCYTNADLQRGIELEKQARLLYEMETGIKVKEVGFIELDEWTGCSPDGLIKEEYIDLRDMWESIMLKDMEFKDDYEKAERELYGGIIEIKCPKDTVFLNQIIHDKIKPEYYTQIQFNMYVSGSKYCDYIAYNMNYPLFIKRIERDEDYINKIKKTINECIKKIVSNLEILKSKNFI